MNAIQRVALAITAALAAIVAALAAAAGPGSVTSSRKRKQASSAASRGSLNLYRKDEKTREEGAGKEGAEEEDPDA